MLIFLIEKKPNGEWLSVVHDELSSYDRDRIKRGIVRSVYISAEDAKLPLDLIARLCAAKAEQTASIATARAIPLDTIVGIIKTSDEEGERDAARLVYKKITGKDYIG